MITIDFEQFTEKRGLKDVVRWLNQQSLPVKEVRGNNLPKRENGFQVKTADIEFESGQILTVKAKVGAEAFFQCKLNGKVLAIRDYKNLDNEMRELANYVKENEPKYAKNQEKALARVKVKVAMPKAVNSTVSEQTDALQAGISDLQGQNEAVTNQLTETTAQVNLKVNSLTDLQSKLDAEKATTADLEAALEKAKQGIFESAADLPCDDPEEAGEDPEDEATETTEEEVVEGSEESVFENSEKEPILESIEDANQLDNIFEGVGTPAGDDVQKYKKMLGKLYNEAYVTPVKLKGYPGKGVNALMAHGSDAGKVLIMANKEWTAADHKRLAGLHSKAADDKQKEWSKVADQAAMKAWGRKYQVSDYKVSGIASDEFDKASKDKLRELAQGEGVNKQLAYAHEQAAKNFNRYKGSK